jgi:hypothetical protein
LSAQGLPPLLLALGFGSSFSIFFHRSSVSFQRVFSVMGRSLLSMTKFTLYYVSMQN